MFHSAGTDIFPTVQASCVILRSFITSNIMSSVFLPWKYPASVIARDSLVLKSPGWGLLVSTIPMPLDCFLCSQYVSGVLNGVYGSQSTAWAQSPFGVQYLIGIDFHLVPSPKPNPSRRAQPGFYHQPIQGYAFWPKTAATLDELE